MGKMEALYHQTNHLLKEIEHNFQKLSQIHNIQQTLEVENEIQLKITKGNSNCDRLDVLLNKLPLLQRQHSKLRVDQLKYDLRHLQSSLERARERRQRREQELSEREQLLNRRFTANNNAAETCLEMDYELQHHTQLGNAHRDVDDMIASGNSILDSLINQRGTLQGAHKRILAIGSTLGLSNHTMKLIERRLFEDKYIMYGGIIVTLVTIFLIIYFLVL